MFNKCAYHVNTSNLERFHLFGRITVIKSCRCSCIMYSKFSFWITYACIMWTQMATSIFTFWDSDVVESCHLFNPRPPESFSVTRHPKVGLLQPPPWIFYMSRPIPVYLLPMYSYGSPLSIDTKKVPFVFVVLHYNVSAPLKFWQYSQSLTIHKESFFG